jgi:hypothetical protein
MKKNFFALIVMSIIYTTCFSQKYNLSGNDVRSDYIVRTEITMSIENGKLTRGSGYNQKTIDIDQFVLSDITEEKRVNDNLFYTTLLSKTYTSVDDSDKTNAQIEYDNIQGETVELLKGFNGKYSVVDTSSYSKTDIEEIERSINFNDEFELLTYPASVSVGDSWVVEDSELVHKFCGVVKEGECEYTLLKVIKNKKEKIAIIYFTINMKCVNVVSESNVVEMDFLYNGKIKRSISYGIDREISGKGVLTMTYIEKKRGRDVKSSLTGKSFFKGKQQLFKEI